MRTILSRVVAAGFISALAAPAYAATILTLESPGSATFQQILNSPCVIGNPSCNQPVGFGETNIPVNTSPYDVTSPTYTVGQIKGVLGTPDFFVGIDVNSTTHPQATEQLDLFTMSVNGVVEAIYDPPSPGTILADINNGNGFSDDLLKGFDLSSFASTDTVTFRAVVNTATDGQEQFFLISTSAPPVPEPMSLTLLGTGVIGLAVAARRRRKVA